MIQKRFQLFSILIIAMLALARADNPVACSIGKVTGKWTFSFDLNTVKKGDNNFEKMSCGRGQPAEVIGYKEVEDAQAQKLAHINGLDDPSDLELHELTLDLTHDSNKLYVLGENGNQIEEGEWTMVVHEGMQGFFSDPDPESNELIYFDAFFRYNAIDNGNYESICYETMIGWYHTSKPNNEGDEDWGCFFAKKNDLTEEDLNKDNHIIFGGGGPKLGDSSGGGTCASSIKNGKISWYKDTNKGIATDASFIAKSYDDGGSTSTPVSTDKVSRENKGKLSELGDYQSLVGMNPNSIELSDLPVSMNWNNINGFSFYPEIINQGCGDCYLWATKMATESRIMIRTNGADHTKISIQHQKDCNFYIEGCDGGLPINVVKWGWEFFLVEEEYYDQLKSSGKGSHVAAVVYTEVDEDASLKHEKDVCVSNEDLSDESKRHKVKDYYYVGGNYGGVSEELIMKEVMAHGPVTAVLNAPSYLQQYKGCIFTQQCNNSPGEVAFVNQDYYKNHDGEDSEDFYGHKVNKKTLWENGVEWEMVNHSIVIVGWGKDDTCPNPKNPQATSRLVMFENNSHGHCDPEEFDGSYWVIANSWGDKFGENGFLRLRRGCNDFGIETQALSIIPRVDCDADGNDDLDWDLVTTVDPYVCPS